VRVRTILAAALLPLAIACDHRQIESKPPTIVPPPTAAPLPAKLLAEATAGVTDPALRDLLARHWSWWLAEDPVWATKYGDHRFDDRVADLSAQHHAVRVQQERAFLAEANALHPGNEADRVTLALLVDQLDTDLAGEVCSFMTWSIGAYSDNPVTAWSTLADSHKVETPKDGANLLARYRQIPGAIDTTVTNLRSGLATGRVATAESIRRVVAMVDNLLATKTLEWDLASPIKEAHTGWAAADRDAFRRGIEAAIEGEIRPAYARYRALLTGELLPRARGEAEAGVSFVPDGAACYRSQIRAHTTLPATAAELHQLGLDEIAKVNGEMVRLGEKLFGTRDLKVILEKLRSDPALYFTTEAEIEAKATAALAAAKAKIPQYFGVLPRTDCVVHRVPDVEAPFTTIAYYREPNPDGTKPGEYMINVSSPTKRARFEAEVLAYHESIPGHHLQIALAMEEPAVPAFRRFLGFTAFVEGWALYVERLADEMGLYHGDLDRMGMLSFDAWRASRLVVDTGIHAEGWTRAQAITFMMDHTALARTNIENEVDRYIYWPGQALGYKTGQLALLRLRKKAETALGPRFDLKGFHDAVLHGGAVTLPVLDARVEAWIASRRGAPPG
jgi:uncharacterized protein (DUF885 family)